MVHKKKNTVVYLAVSIGFILFDKKKLFMLVYGYFILLDKNRISFIELKLKYHNCVAVQLVYMVLQYTQKIHAQLLYQMGVLKRFTSEPPVRLNGKDG